MEPKKTYSEQLKDPRWQKKRLEIMQRDGFKCRFCGDINEQLVVHHRIYEKSKQVFEYSNDKLITLCNSCHTILHDKGNSKYFEIFFKDSEAFSGNNENKLKKYPYDIIIRVGLLIGMSDKELSKDIKNNTSKYFDPSPYAEYSEPTGYGPHGFFTYEEMVDMEIQRIMDNPNA